MICIVRVCVLVLDTVTCRAYSTAGCLVIVAMDDFDVHDKDRLESHFIICVT